MHAHLNSVGGRLHLFVLPDPDDHPTFLTKERIGSAIARDVRLSLTE